MWISGGTWYWDLAIASQVLVSSFKSLPYKLEGEVIASTTAFWQSNQRPFIYAGRVTSISRVIYTNTLLTWRAADDTLGNNPLFAFSAE